MFDCASTPSEHICGPSSVGGSSILEGTDSGEGVNNGVTSANGDGIDDVESMFLVTRHGKDAALGATPYEIGVRVGTEEDVCVGVGDGEGKSGFGWSHPTEDISITKIDVTNYT
ncbi:hypothetical protein VNO80_30555 [Phaseolus coccineus]|uniref:Uncharacterized protein n=1 Tax=Phaseolus coccineus TaxID=3886 RepID=A0AAN9LGP9_PHACN